MWFAFPQGYDRISVERQEFVPEFTDDNGTEYFRAPNHFAPQILSIKGFVAKEPQGAPADLPQPDPLRDSAIALLTQERESLRSEVANMRSDIAAAVAKVTALNNEKTLWLAEKEKLEVRITDLEEELEDRPAKPAAPLPLPKAK